MSWAGEDPLAAARAVARRRLAGETAAAAPRVVARAVARRKAAAGAAAVAAPLLTSIWCGNLPDKPAPDEFRGFVYRFVNVRYNKAEIYTVIKRKQNVS